MSRAWRHDGRSIKELRDRVGSVKNTKKITSAMKLVAAAKVATFPRTTLRRLRLTLTGVSVSRFLFGLRRAGAPCPGRRAQDPPFL